VGGLAIAFAIWLGAGAFEFVGQVIRPTLPLEQGERIVGIHNLNRASAEAETPTLHDFATWRRELSTVEELGAFRLLERNLVSAEGSAEPVEVAETSASAFRVARVPALLGRPLAAADERPDADPVAVIGHDVWQRRFGSDPGIVGREIRLGRDVHTVVGVMPEGFAFPIAQSLWVPLRLDPLASSPGESPRVRVFGRLAPGVSMAEAQAQLALVGRRAAAAQPGTHEHLRPQVLSYARSVMGLPTLAVVGMGSVNLFLAMLLVLVCGNVALLMFARAVSRESELAVRSALGASRGRIVGQLFVEALVLAAAGALLGLAAVEVGLEWMFAEIRAQVPQIPFWIRPHLSASTILYSALLTVLAALVAGVVPGLKVTRGLRARLQRASAGGGGFRFGGIWTAVIVAQVAVTVAFPVVAFMLHLEVSAIRTVDVGFPDEQYLAVRVEMDAGAPADAAGGEFRARYAEAVRRLEERLAAEPGVESVTFGESLPRLYHPDRLVELDGGGAAPPHPGGPAHRVSAASVAPDFFEAFDAPILAGRGFHSGDHESAARVVVVSRSFVDEVLGGRNPIGRRIRLLPTDAREGSSAPEPGSWHEIVGVVQDIGVPGGDFDPTVAGVYHPVAPGGVYPGHLAVRLRGDPAAFAPRLRRLAARLEPGLRLHDVQPLNEAHTAELRFISFWFWLTAAVSGVAMFLSLAGIYAVMAFTVSQRTREIGIRVALGGTAERVVRAIFRRPLGQVGLGIVLGAALSALLVASGERTALTLPSAAVLVVYAATMMGVCLLACIVPTRRALGVEPTEALKAEG
jgi:predicted permease